MFYYYIMTVIICSVSCLSLASRKVVLHAQQCKGSVELGILEITCRRALMLFTLKQSTCMIYLLMCLP